MARSDVLGCEGFHFHFSTTQVSGALAGTETAELQMNMQIQVDPRLQDKLG